MVMTAMAILWTGMVSFELDYGMVQSRPTARLLRRLASISRPLLQGADQDELTLEASGSESVHVFH